MERIGLTVGLLELFFLPAALMAHPDWRQLAHGLTSIPLNQGNFLFLLAANVGGRYNALDGILSTGGRHR